MNFIKKYTQGIALFFFLIILPIGSYYYLLTGLNFYKDNRSEYMRKGVVPEFKTNGLLSKKEISDQDLFGHTFVLSFFDAKAKENTELVDAMTLVQTQFLERKDVKQITFLSDSLTTENKKLVDLAKPVKNKWYILEGNEQTASFMKEKVKLTEVYDNYSPQFVLVDDSLNIRGYYDVTDGRQRNKLIHHLSMVMPRKKKKEVVFRREKEK